MGLKSGSASFELVIPAATYKASVAPIQKIINLARTKILGAYFQFPSGCAYLAEVQIGVTEGNNSSNLLVPSAVSADALDYIAFDGATGLLIPINHTIETIAKVFINGWNEDDTNQHWIKVLLTLETLD